MTTQYVIDTLKDENKLLEDMIRFVHDYPNGAFTGSARYIQKSWELFLGERRRTNVTLTDKAQQDLKKDLEEERAQVDQYFRQTNSQLAYSEQWPKFLKCEMQILDHLIGECD